MRSASISAAISNNSGRPSAISRRFSVFLIISANPDELDAAAKSALRRALSYSHIQQRPILAPRDRLADERGLDASRRVVHGHSPLAGTWPISGPTSSVFAVTQKPICAGDAARAEARRRPNATVTSLRRQGSGERCDDTVLTELSRLEGSQLPKWLISSECLAGGLHSSEGFWISRSVMFEEELELRFRLGVAHGLVRGHRLSARARRASARRRAARRQARRQGVQRDAIGEEGDGNVRLDARLLLMEDRLDGEIALLNATRTS